MKSSIFVWSESLLRWFSEDKKSDASNCSKSSISATRISPFYFNAWPREIPGNTFLPNWCTLVIFWSDRMIFNHCSKRYCWPCKRFFESSFVWCFPICQEVLDVSQKAIAFHRVGPPFIQSWNDFWLSRNFRKLFSVSCEDYVLKWIRLNSLDSHPSLKTFCVIRRYQDTKLFCSYRWLFRGSLSSLKTSWSAVSKSPNFTARSRDSPMRLLQRALVILVLKQTSQFRYFGKWVNIPCFLDFVTTVVGCFESESWEICAGACTSVASRLSLNSCSQNGRSDNGSSASFLSSLRDSCPSLLVASSSLRSNTEPEDELDAALFSETWCASGPKDSCWCVVDDELLSELTEPWNDKRYEIVCLADTTFLILGQSSLLTVDPLKGVSVIFAKLA